jgi:hypothetical protein
MFFQQVCAGLIFPAGRIFRGYSDQVRQQVGHLVLARIQPGEQALARSEANG